MRVPNCLTELFRRCQSKAAKPCVKDVCLKPTRLANIKHLIADEVDKEMSCWHCDASQVITKRKAVFSEELANFADECYVTQAAWKLGQALCTMRCFFVCVRGFFLCYYEIHSTEENSVRD